MKCAAAILVVLCLALLQSVNADVKIFRKSLNVTDRRLAFWAESYTDEHLTYALCNNKHPQADDINCDVMREKKPYRGDNFSCNVILKRPHGPHNPKRLPEISVYPFGQKYAALTVWEEDKYLNFSVVQMENCKVSEAGIYTDGSLLSRFYVTVVGHSDSFDVFFEDRAGVLMCGEKMCKATIGVDGKLISEPKPSVKKLVRSDFVLRSIVAIDNGSSGNGYFYVTPEGNDYIHILVKPDGTETSLARHPKPSGFVGISTKNNILGVCYQMDKKLECSQYDFDGNLKRNMTIISGDKIIVYFDIFNLPTGGFYLFSAECKGEFYNHCRDYPRFFIERVDANNTTTGPIIFQGFVNSFNSKVMTPLFYENDDKETCVSLAATRVTEDDVGRSDITANCFTDADFSK